MIERWIRSQRAAVAEHGDAVYLIARDGVVRRIEADSAELARVVLAYLTLPRTEPELLAHLEKLAGPLVGGRDVVVQLLALLAESGATTRVVDAASVPARAAGANIVVAVSGAIAATHAPAFVTALQRRGHTVEVALTGTAQRFVAVDALAAIVGREIHTSLWPATPHTPVPHVVLAQWADLVVVYPTSATTLGRIANGDFSDLVSALALTTRAPVVLVPSMNVEMLAAPALRRNIDKLRGDGFMVVHGVPSQEVADAPSVRGSLAAVAAAPGELAATIDAMRAAGVLVRSSGRDGEDAATRRRASNGSDWDAIYRASARDGAVLPWASAECDDDLAAALAEHAPPPGRLLDVGCGLGQVSRHALARGYQVVATDVSEVALRFARDRDAALDARSEPASITWVRDEICASHLVGPFDVIVDRATLHTLAPARLHAWAATMCRLTRPGSALIVKAHRDGVAGVTNGWSPRDLCDHLSDFELVVEQPAELPGLVDATPIPSMLVVLRRT